MNNHVIDILKVQTTAVLGLTTSQLFDLFISLNEAVQVVGTTVIIMLTLAYTIYKTRLMRREHNDDMNARRKDDEQ